jgi:hypothetical protein
MQAGDVEVAKNVVEIIALGSAFLWFGFRTFSGQQHHNIKLELTESRTTAGDHARSKLRLAIEKGENGRVQIGDIHVAAYAVSKPEPGTTRLAPSSTLLADCSDVVRLAMTEAVLTPQRRIQTPNAATEPGKEQRLAFFVPGDASVYECFVEIDKEAVLEWRVSLSCHRMIGKKRYGAAAQWTGSCVSLPAV